MRGLPKAELHLHIEGTLEPELAFELAGKHGIILPYGSVESLRTAYDFTDLQSFLDLYYSLADVLKDAEDFEALASQYLEKAHAEGIVHVEIFFDPQAHTGRGIDFATVVEGLSRALEDGQRRFGMTHRLIACFLRHLPAADAMQTLDAILEHRGTIHGVALTPRKLDIRLRSSPRSSRARGSRDSSVSRMRARRARRSTSPRRSIS